MKELVMYSNPTVEANIKKYLNSKVNYQGLSKEEKITIIKKLECSCKSCDLHYSSPYSNVPSILNTGSSFLFIGRNPNGNEAKSNQLFPSQYRNGGIFKKYLQLLGISQTSMSAINLCNCYARGNRPPTQEEINKCITFRHMELEAIGDNLKVIFPMGQDALKWLYGTNHPGSLQCHGYIYLSLFNDRPILVIPLIHPSHLAIEPAMGKEVAKWLRKLSVIIKKLETQSVEDVYKDIIKEDFKSE